MKILASDYDGTLRIDGRVSDEDKAAIARFRRSGGKFGIVTGRGYVTITEEIRTQGLTCDFLICNNGSLVYVDGKPLESCLIDGEYLAPLVERVITAGGRYAAINHFDRRVCAIFGENADKTDGAQFVSLENLPRFGQFNQVDTRMPDEKVAADFAKAINREFDGILTAHNNGSCVDTVRYGVCKSSGLRRYLERCGGEAADLVTVGDNFNDVDMLTAYHGYVLESGNPVVVEKIGRTCKSVAALIESMR